MNKSLELTRLGGFSSQSNSSKSLLNTINTGFDNVNEDDNNEIISNITLQIKPQVEKNNSSILDTLDTGFGDYNKVIIEEPKIEINVLDYTIHFCNEDCKGELIVNENIIPNVPTIVIKNECNKDSILNTMDSGFGSENTIVTECKKPVYKTHLCKESYFSEFKSESEKNLARTNLDVYSKEETHIVLLKVVSDFITKDELEESFKDLNYTTSRLKSNVNYEIPDNLFK